MAVTEIAARFAFKCDGCEKVEERPTKSRPPYWTGLNIEADAYDFQGAAVADASVKRILCSECTSVVHSAINASIILRRTAITKAQEQG